MDPVYPVIIIDAIVLKVREGVANRPVYVAMGVNLDVMRDVLGMWVGPSGGEGAKQSINMLTDLEEPRTRWGGVERHRGDTVVAGQHPATVAPASGESSPPAGFRAPKVARPGSGF
jgi:hypothetical protein